MITKSFRRDIASLADSKGRKKLGAFVVEGSKCVLDTLDHFSLRYLIATQAWCDFNKVGGIVSSKIVIANRGEIGEMSSMSLAPDVMAVYDLPECQLFDAKNLKNTLVVALDRVQDPGNLGTIIRTADWMGVTNILASHDTVDCFNPKVVQATMGAISRVKIIYGNLVEMLSYFEEDTPIYGTFLDGENIYKAKLSNHGIIVMGNEGRGISDNVERMVNRRIMIPPYPLGRPTSESLNVAIATAITLSQFRNRNF